MGALRLVVLIAMAPSNNRRFHSAVGAPSGSSVVS